MGLIINNLRSIITSIMTLCLKEVLGVILVNSGQGSTFI